MNNRFGKSLSATAIVLLDGCDVSYEYRGRQYQLMMPYDPGRHIKMRIEFAPVI